MGFAGVGAVKVLMRRGVPAGLVRVSEVVGRGCSSSSVILGGNIGDGAELKKLSRSSDGRLDKLLARDRIEGLNNAVFGSPSTRNIDDGDLPGVPSIFSSSLVEHSVSTVIGRCLDS